MGGVGIKNSRYSVGENRKDPSFLFWKIESKLVDLLSMAYENKDSSASRYFKKKIWFVLVNRLFFVNVQYLLMSSDKKAFAKKVKCQIQCGFVSHTFWITENNSTIYLPPLI